MRLQVIRFAIDRQEKHFLLFPKCFQKPSSSKVGFVWYRVYWFLAWEKTESWTLSAFVDCQPLSSVLKKCLKMEYLNLGLYHKTFLTLSQTTNFRLFQIERICRRQFQMRWKWQHVLQTRRKHCGEKGEIARHKQFLLFQQCFQKPCNADIKNLGLFGKMLRTISVLLSWVF